MNYLKITEVNYGIYKAISVGNASTLGIWEYWNGAAWVAASVLPSLDDDVYTNNNIVTITTSQSYNSLNRSSLSSPVLHKGVGNFKLRERMKFTLSGQVNGSNVNFPLQQSSSACVNRLATHTNKFHRIGDDVGGSGNNCYAFWNGSAYNIDIIGNQIGGSGANVMAFIIMLCVHLKALLEIKQVEIGTNVWGFYNNAASTFNSIIGNQTGGRYCVWYNNMQAYNFFVNNGPVQSGIFPPQVLVFTTLAIYAKLHL